MARVWWASIRLLIAKKLGRCARCVRLSLILSLLSWLAFAILTASIPGSFLANGAFVAALGFTGLFASHLAAFIVRVILKVRNADRANPGNPTARRPSALSVDRRRFLTTSVKMVGVGLAAVAIPSLLTSNSLADTNCPSYCICTKNCKPKMGHSCPGYQYCADLCRLGCGP